MPYPNLREHLKNRAGDKEFMLKVLAHITNRDHYFFKKDYFPPKRTVEHALQYEFQNTDHFFDGLPDSKRVGKNSQAMRLLIPIEKRKEFELRKAQYRITQLEAKTKKIQEDMIKQKEK